MITFCLKPTFFYAQSKEGIVLASTSSKACIYVPENIPLLQIAGQALSHDISLVADKKPELISNLNHAPENCIMIGTINSPIIKQYCQNNKLADISGKWEHFIIKVVKNESGHGKILLVVGSDPRGTAYGVFTISRMIGVSPWNWWADVAPVKQSDLYIKSDINIAQGPSVKYRGIFLNDEDWGLRPWASKTFEPDVNNIGPKTYSRIFELLLRLKANTIWPAMHPGTKPFFTVPGNKEVAQKYDIVIGTSHAEPMLRNNVGEWDGKKMGAFNYVTNSNTINDYWEQRVQQSKGGEDIYTIGIRGVHDSKMEGASSLDDQKAILNKVFETQRGFLKKYINPDIEKVPQVFVPYKEVLPVYNAGLKVPDDVTLMWCDDNYGYINRLSNEIERKRAGGSGVYYHLSYWGAPHDYLWLSTTPPGLIKEEMTKAYNHGARTIWIANVGDIKPIEYNTELFLDLAWNINGVDNVSDHLLNWLDMQFGKSVAEKLQPLMSTYYRLAEIRKPAFLGNSRVYDKARESVKDLPWSEAYIIERLQEYKDLSDMVQTIASQIPSERKDAYFELIQYPVQAANQMNIKLLDGQLARHQKTDWLKSDNAYDSIVHLTERYNKLKGGKWKYMMDFQPRDLPVFRKLQHETVKSPLRDQKAPAYKVVVDKFQKVENASLGQPNIIQLLGYDGKAVELPKSQQITYLIKDPASENIEIELRVLPTHAINGNQLRVAVTYQDQTQMVDFNTKENSEDWKENVLRNQAIIKLSFKQNKKTANLLKLKAIDGSIVIDEILVNKLD